MQTNALNPRPIIAQPILKTWLSRCRRDSREANNERPILAALDSQGRFQGRFHGNALAAHSVKR